MAMDARVHGDAVRFSVRVQPRASKNEIAGAYGSALRIRLTAPPVEGMANEALIDFLSKTLGVARTHVAIISGHSSRTKLVEVTGIGVETIQRLGG